MGTPDEIYFAPQTVYVAGFVGSPAMNLLSVRLDSKERRFVGDGFTLPAAPILERLKLDGSQDAEFSLGIRPEHTDISFDARPEAIHGSVYAVEPMGNETLIYVSVGSTHIVARADALVRAAVNTPCALEFRIDRLHLFDGSSLERIPERSGSPIPRNIAEVTPGQKV
jgi:multiple sugar transport system ATP-binding protein